MIAFLRDEPGAAIVADALLDAESKCYAHALNFCEVFYDFCRVSGRKEAMNAVLDLRSLGVVEDADLSIATWQAAGVLKARHRRVSLADCFALELAERLGGVILTADHHEFDVLVAQATHSIRFIR